MKHILLFESFIVEELTHDQLKSLENFADDLFNKLGIDVVFTKHFKDRINDARTGKPITYYEVQQLFLKAYNKAGQEISKLPPDTEAVLKDISSNLNAPFKIQDAQPSHGDADTDMVMKTIMKKPHFMSSNPDIRV
jgi:hypothetical protein